MGGDSTHGRPTGAPPGITHPGSALLPARTPRRPLGLRSAPPTPIARLHGPQAGLATGGGPGPLGSHGAHRPHELGDLGGGGGGGVTSVPPGHGEPQACTGMGQALLGARANPQYPWYPKLSFPPSSCAHRVQVTEDSSLQELLKDQPSPSATLRPQGTGSVAPVASARGSRPASAGGDKAAGAGALGSPPHHHSPIAGFLTAPSWRGGGSRVSSHNGGHGAGGQG